MRAARPRTRQTNPSCSLSNIHHAIFQAIHHAIFPADVLAVNVTGVCVCTMSHVTCLVATLPTTERALRTRITQHEGWCDQLCVCVCLSHATTTERTHRTLLVATANANPPSGIWTLAQQGLTASPDTSAHVTALYSHHAKQSHERSAANTGHVLCIRCVRTHLSVPGVSRMNVYWVVKLVPSKHTHG